MPQTLNSTQLDELYDLADNVKLNHILLTLDHAGDAMALPLLQAAVEDTYFVLRGLISDINSRLILWDLPRLKKGC